MRAAVLHETGGPEVLRIEDVPAPRPGPAEILVQVAACGICGHDQADRSGLTPVKRPAILGHEISGIVTDVGDKVQAFKPGDRVACKQITTCGWCDACRGGREMQCRSRHFNYGGWAEFVVLSEQALLKVPDEVDLVGASVVSCAVGSCLRALRQVAKLLPGERVVVTGAGGGLGIHGMQVAKALGAYTIALTSSPDKADDLRALGADAVVVAAGRDYWQEILALTDGRGADVVLDNVGHPGVFGPCFRGLAQGGRYVFTGQVERQKIDLYPAFVFGKEAVITGSASTRLAEFIDSMELVRSGKVRPVVQAYSLQDVVQANQRLEERGFVGRGVLVP
jgi:D-arabinose 1-dehydrogenase-like Zn-dependent alcohol dehydrogenase